MTSAKISMSIDSSLVQFIESYQSKHHLSSRSEVMTEALNLLRQQDLREQYRAAMIEWCESEDAALWENTVGDGLVDDDFTRGNY